MKAILLASTVAAAMIINIGFKAMAKTEESESLKVWFDDAEFVADGKTITKVKFYEHDTVTYAAFNMVLTVPRGIKIAKVKSGREMINDIELTDRGTSVHSIACNMLDDSTTIKIICTPTGALESFYDDDVDGNKIDHLFTLGLTAEPYMEDGEYMINMTGVKFGEVNTNAYVPKVEPITGLFTITGGLTTGIDSVTADNADEGDYYDLMGRKVEGKLLPGIYVHNGKKIMVK